MACVNFVSTLKKSAMKNLYLFLFYLSFNVANTQPIYREIIGLPGYLPLGSEFLVPMAGNDVLLCSENVPAAIAKIKEAIINEQITTEEIDRRVKKILKAKYWAGLNAYKPVEMANLTADLKRPASTLVQQQLYEQSATLVRNEGDLIPFRALDTISFASVSIGTGPDNTFTRTLKKYAPVTAFNIPVRYASDSTYIKIESSLQKHDVIIVSLHNLNNTPTNQYGIGGGTRRAGFLP